MDYEYGIPYIPTGEIKDPMCYEGVWVLTGMDRTTGNGLADQKKK